MKKTLFLAIIAALLSIIIFFGILMIQNKIKIDTLQRELDSLTIQSQEDQMKLQKMQELYDTLAGLRLANSSLEKQIGSLQERLEKYEPDPMKEGIKNLDPNIFVTDPENYAPTDNTIRLTAEQAAVIAQKGFEESAKRIAGEGADNIESQTVELILARPNNYFTHYGKFQWYPTERNCYHFTRTNEMRCGIDIYVDATTGLIIGGSAFGD